MLNLIKLYFKKKERINMSTNNLTKENIFQNIDFKELVKTNKTQL